MNCTNCGAPLNENAKFCTSCGTKVEAKTAEPIPPLSEIPQAPAVPEMAFSYENPGARPENPYENPSAYAAYYQQPANPADMLPPQYKPLSPWAYFGLNILYSIPLIGFIFLIVFTFSDGNINRRNHARSYWCSLLLSIILLVIIVILVITLGISYNISGAIEDALSGLV